MSTSTNAGASFRMVQGLASAPILAAFALGSLPIALPLLIYRYYFGPPRA